MGYHLYADTVSRGKGQSVIAKAAYNSRTAILEERTGDLKDFSRHKDKPVKSLLMVNDPERREPGTFWNWYDAQNSRSDAVMAMTFDAALPYQLADEGREFIVKDFMREEFLRKGVAVQGDIHGADKQGDPRNIHAHLLASVCKVGKDGLGERVFSYDSAEKDLERWRRKWADRCARELEKAGFKVEAERWRYGYLPQEQQRQKALERGDMEWVEIKSRVATKHLGPEASVIERRGERSERGDLNRAVKQVNGLKRERDRLDHSIRQEREKLDAPPKTPEDALERGEAMAEAMSRGMQARNKAPDPMKRDGYSWWRRSAFRHRRGTYDAAAAYEKYWREHVWGEREHEGEHER